MSREPAALRACVPDRERMLGGGVGRRDGPKNSALSERGVLWGTRGVSSVLPSDLSVSELVRRWGFGGGEGAEASSEKGEAKNAWVLLPVGDGGGEEVEEAAETAERALRWEERVEEPTEGEGLRW